ncbi:PDR/VanB family oxidoreductase [Asticcacaulis benevestitus]|uniref:Ferredoxin n=1 Tax=Asticcacaulis benevestitus DSM 16100 = ATCC BAA-896 TaxID=1121022 RepID=V4QVK0_9CAUL|nr:PDR/VanB family oxidoreductase [Asticcacaulis benevestitus]ESQ83183.1 hypothetical protein ABENE_20390 [Asticcacaulis benevestitus DSM 16100 = ATCC BAA-896]
MTEVLISGIVQETELIRRIELRREDGQPLPPFTAGAHIDVHLPNGLVRQYSLSNSPRSTQFYELGIRREALSRGGSDWIHTARPGERVRISAPRNLFPLADNARRHLLFAAGIGITPIMSMVRSLQAVGGDFEIFYSVQSRKDAAFLFDLEALKLGAKFKFLADGRHAAMATINAAISHPVTETHLYVCGPRSYVDTILCEARQKGWSEKQLHTEAFAPSSSTALSTDNAFTVLLKRSGRRITVTADMTVAKALELQGVALPVSCEQGICGTCLTRVLSGVPEHRDQYLTDEERGLNDQFTPCCSRSQTPELILDL